MKMTGYKTKSGRRVQPGSLVLDVFPLNAETRQGEVSSSVIESSKVGKPRI